MTDRAWVAWMTASCLAGCELTCNREVSVITGEYAIVDPDTANPVLDGVLVTDGETLTIDYTRRDGTAWRVTYAVTIE